MADMKYIEDSGKPVLPDYQGASISNIVPALLEHEAIGHGWLPDEVHKAKQIVLFVVDGLGYNQLATRQELAPTLSKNVVSALTSVSPSTTANALTSITTGMTPGQHGLVGYKMAMDSEILNVIRWKTEAGDARSSYIPEVIQPNEPFGGRRVPVVTRSAFLGTGFTRAHLRGSDIFAYENFGLIRKQIQQALATGARFVYAYYDRLDIIGHESGHGAKYDVELARIDKTVSLLREELDESVKILVTADHGQIVTGDNKTPIHSSVMELCEGTSGEARCIWLHKKPGVETEKMVELAREHHSDYAWVMSRDEAIESSLFGAVVTPEAKGRLGDVVMIMLNDSALYDIGRRMVILLGRHGGLTADEMYVPLVVL